MAEKQYAQQPPPPYGYPQDNIYPNLNQPQLPPGHYPGYVPQVQGKCNSILVCSKN